MLPTLKNRRGMTLAEIMVCLGVVAIMITMVVSFVILLSDRTRTANENTTTHQDLTLIQTGVEAWVNGVTEDEAVFDTGGEFDPAVVFANSTVKVALTNAVGDPVEFVSFTYIGEIEGNPVSLLEFSLEVEVPQRDEEGNPIQDENDEWLTEIENRTYTVNFVDGIGCLTGETVETQPKYMVTVTYSTVKDFGSTLTGHMFLPRDEEEASRSVLGTLSFANGTLSMQRFGVNSSAMHTETVDSVVFKVMEKATVELKPGDYTYPETDDELDNEGSGNEAGVTPASEDGTNPEPGTEGGDNEETEGSDNEDAVSKPDGVKIEVHQDVDYLYFCTVTFKDGAEHRFTVNPRVGETTAGGIAVQIETQIEPETEGENNNENNGNSAE